MVLTTWYFWNSGEVVEFTNRVVSPRNMASPTWALVVDVALVTALVNAGCKTVSFSLYTENEWSTRNSVAVLEATEPLRMSDIDFAGTAGVLVVPCEGLGTARYTPPVSVAIPSITLKLSE